MYIIKLVKYILTTLLVTFILGLFWYRFSDYFQTLVYDDPDENYWVTTYNLRRVSYEKHLGEINSSSFKLIKCMYFSMTTLSTVGYGDIVPISTAEKFLGSIL